ncbi:MAG TPA: BTAD domain-containing putative transcriptional regulator [Candidatus Limnocylindrales bacterium]
MAAAQQRVLLAVLLAEAGHAVPVERLISEVWGEHPPRTAVRTLQGYVFRLRRVLDDGGSIQTRDGGYAMATGDADVDLAVFERLVAAAKEELTADLADDAEARLSEALALWRGPAFADVPCGPLLSAHAVRFERSKLDAEEEWLDALLRSGQPATAVAEAERLVAAHPLRERLYERLMLGLYRCGRRAEALGCYQRARERLVGDLGVEPGPRLRKLHHEVLNDEPHLTAEKGPVIVAQLPADVAGFTGRDLDLKRLEELLRRDAAPQVVTVAGPPGVGKTALAVHWAHRIRHGFPDGQLYLNLRGYAASPPLRPTDALARFLAALGLPADRIPVDTEAAAALFRSRVGERRMLILLDNANHPDQVRPLLPASPGCLVVVTSRDRLDGLVARDGAVRLTLERLSADDATTLLGVIVGAERVSAEPQAAAQVAAICDHLPLALRIAAADLAAHPRRSIVDYAGRLGAGDRLRALEVPGDERSGVRATFATSYAALGEPARRLLRLLSLPPGNDVTAKAAGALADLPAQEAAGLLDQLCAAHLVTEHAAGRFAMHDLLRLYAAGRAEEEDTAPERRAALDRWYTFHLHAVDAAAERLYPQILRLPADSSTLDAFPDGDEASQWLDAERANLAAAIVHAASHGPQPMAWRLADALRGYLYLGDHTVDWRAVADAAHAAATAAGDADALVSAELSLATLGFVLNWYDSAIEHNSRALELARRSGWAAGEATALCNMGAAYWALGDTQLAASHHAAALEIDLQIDRVQGQAANVGNLGPIYAALGHLDLAAEHRELALTLSHRIGSQRLEGINLAGLAEVRHAQGRHDDAIAAAEAALKIFQASGQSQNEPYPRCILARVLRDRGEPEEAMRHARTALSLARDHEDDFREAAAHATIGGIHLRLGQPSQAAERHSRALDLAAGVGDRYTQTEATIGLAAALHATGAADGATAHVRQALSVAREHEYRLLECDALTVLAATLPDPDESARCAAQAQAIRTDTGYSPAG